MFTFGVSITMDTSVKFGVLYSAHTTADVAKKGDKMVPPSFKVLVKKKANHNVKQTFCIANRRMVGSMKISRRNPCSPFFSVSYSINRHKIL